MNKAFWEAHNLWMKNGTDLIQASILATLGAAHPRVTGEAVQELYWYARTTVDNQGEMEAYGNSIDPENATYWEMLEAEFTALVALVRRVEGLVS